VPNVRRPVVLFFCTHNAGRSQMALGFFAALAGERATGWSGGSEPGNEINPAAIAAIAERGIDPAGLDVADVRPIRDELERRVHALLDQISVTTA
jgi:arsenate reductase (thioredoxin)